MHEASYSLTSSGSVFILSLSTTVSDESNCFPVQESLPTQCLTKSASYLHSVFSNHLTLPFAITNLTCSDASNSSSCACFFI